MATSISRVRLNRLSKEEMTRREQNATRGGRTCGCDCSCSCYDEKESCLCGPPENPEYLMWGLEVQNNTNFFADESATSPGTSIDMKVEAYN